MSNGYGNTGTKLVADVSDQGINNKRTNGNQQLYGLWDVLCMA